MTNLLVGTFLYETDPLTWREYYQPGKILVCWVVVEFVFIALFDYIRCTQEISAITFSVLVQSAIFTERSGGVAAIVCDTTENTVQQGFCETCHAIGGYLGRVTKCV